MVTFQLFILRREPNECENIVLRAPHARATVYAARDPGRSG